MEEPGGYNRMKHETPAPLILSASRHLHVAFPILGWTAGLQMTSPGGLSLPLHSLGICLTDSLEKKNRYSPTFTHATSVLHSVTYTESE